MTPLSLSTPAPCRTVQLTVSNTLVGRIIGLGGAKINSIQVPAAVCACGVAAIHARMLLSIRKSLHMLMERGGWLG